MRNVILLVLLVTVGLLLMNNQPAMTRAQNREPQITESNRWTPCEFGYYTENNGVSFDDDAFEIEKKYSAAMLTVNVESKASLVSVRLVGGDNPVTLGILHKAGSAVYPIQNSGDSYHIEVMTSENSIIDLCRISIIPYK